MAEYIERKAAIKTAEHAYNEWNLAMAAADGKREINLVYKRQELCKAVASIFDSAPAADVAPVVRGEWIERKEHLYLANGDCKEWVNFYCSECDAPNNSPFCYCPNCGAKMDGGTKNAID